jgi:radical SAM protein with 4Fe4S-binding SPASM domain
MATWSRYNFFVPQTDGSALLYNARLGELIRLDAERVRECDGQQDLDDNFFTFLLQRGFLVADDLDEVELVAKQHEVARADSSALSVTVELTEACNFRCVYCYQGHAKEHLQGDIEQRVLRYLGRKIAELRHLHINWFGGEPLTRLPTLRRLSAELRGQAEAHGCRLTQFLTTNGYLITAAVAADLKALGISNVQITLDGAGDFHDRSRPLASGRGTYQRVLEACRHVVDADIELMVRINLNRINANSVNDLLGDLVAHGVTPDKAIIHIVRAIDHGNLDESASSICFKNAEFARKWGELLGYVSAHGFGTPTIAPIAYNCPFDLEQAVMIGRDGSLRHCSSTDHEIARLDAEGQEVDLNPTYDRVKNRRPTDDPHCRDCRYLPLCMGGCSYLRERGQEACNPERYILPRLVELYASQASF